MQKALHILEEIYNMALNPDADYFDQLEPLSQTGELANKVHLTKVVMKLCMLLDAQVKEIEHLKDRLEGKSPAIDPSKPLA